LACDILPFILREAIFSHLRTSEQEEKGNTGNIAFSLATSHAGSHVGVCMLGQRAKKWLRVGWG